MKVYCLIVGAVILLDIISGLLKASYKKTFKSCYMRDGLYHKCGELLVLALLWGVEYGSPLVGLETGLPLFKVGCGYVILMEIGSIVENLRAFTPNIDNILKRGDNHVN
jgi:hypothetical protein